MPFEALLSDMDGTLVDSEDQLFKASSIVCERRGCDYSQFDTNIIMGLNADKAIAIILEHFGIDEDPKEVVVEWRVEARRLVYANVKVCPGVLETLDIIERRKVPKIVVTTSGTEYSEKVLTLTGLRDRFSGIISMDTVRSHGMRPKPAPDPYLHAAKVLKVRPSRCLVFEDSAHGVMSGMQAGCYVIAVCHGNDKMRRALLTAGADQVLDSLEEFRAAIAQVRA